MLFWGLGLQALDRLATDIRYSIDLVGFLRHEVSLDEAKSIIEQRLARRAESFLDILERGVYANPRSPYRRLLDHAGIGLADVQRMLRNDGLEAALEQLCAASVYVTSEEMKGRRPIRRDGLEFTVEAADFENPLVGSAHMLQTSSGSTGRPVTVRTSLKSSSAECVSVAVAAAQLGDRPQAFWSPGGVVTLIISTKLGAPPERLFFTMPPLRGLDGLRQRAIMAYTRFWSARFGHPLPQAEVVTRDQAVTIARWLAAMRERGRPAAMLCHSNPAVRICHAAQQHDIDISGTLFYVYGEPFTSGKAAVLASVGASAVVAYAMSEVGGLVAITCPNATELDDAHLFTDKLAVIQRDRTVAPGESVGALLLTSIQPDCPRLLLNADTGDYATISTRSCDCLMGRLGLNTHLHGIRSYEKLTSEGITFAGSRLYELVEEVLPARFGGGVNDYQLVEEEHEDALSRVSVVVSPRVGDVDEAAVIATVLEALEITHARQGGATMADTWRQGGNLQVVRREPYETRAKVLPLQVLRRLQ